MTSKTAQQDVSGWLYVIAGVDVARNGDVFGQGKQFSDNGSIYEWVKEERIKKETNKVLQADGTYLME